MAIYSSKGFNWKQYEVVPEKTHVWFSDDLYTEITFREFATIIELYETPKYYSGLDTLSIEINQKILKEVFSMEEETVIGLPYKLKRMKDLFDTNLQYVSSGLIMTMSIIYSCFYYGKQMAEIYGYKNHIATNYNDFPCGENCVFEIPPEVKYATISSVLYREDSNLALRRIKGEQKVYERNISLDTTHILEQLKGVIFENINYEDTEQLKELKKCFNPKGSIADVINIVKSTCDSENKVKQVMENIRDRCCELVNEKADYIFSKIMNQFTNEKPKYWTIAIGDGEDTTSILGIVKFGLLLFNYDYYIDKEFSTGVKTSKEHTIENEQIEKGQILHIDSIGVENNNDVKCEITIKKIDGTLICKNDVNVLITNMLNIDEDFFYENNSDGRQVAIVEFRKNTNDFFFKKDCMVSLKFSTREDGKEDAMFFVSKIKDYQNTESLLYYNSFNSAEFRLTEVEMCSLYNANKDVFDDITKKVRDGFAIEPILTGEFVGKAASICPYSDKDVEADKSYCLGYIENSLIEEGTSSDNENLRMSRVVIKTDFENKKLMVNIVSHTSPRKVNLTLTESEYKNERGVISHNQVLAMLRSMGMFEAICFILYSLSINVDIKEKIERTLNYSCVCDKTGTSRNIPCLNIKKNIKYNDFLKIDGDTERIIKELNLN